METLKIQDSRIKKFMDNNNHFIMTIPVGGRHLMDILYSYGHPVAYFVGPQLVYLGEKWEFSRTTMKYVNTLFMQKSSYFSREFNPSRESSLEELRNAWKRQEENKITLESRLSLYV